MRQSVQVYTTLFLFAGTCRGRRRYHVAMPFCPARVTLPSSGRDSMDAGRLHYATLNVILTRADLLNQKIDTSFTLALGDSFVNTNFGFTRLRFELLF